MAGIYLHIPFCKQACSYCDFYFSTQKKLIEPFTDALINEIDSYRDSNFSENPIRTLYIGGGTPSLLKEQHLNRIFDALSAAFEMDLQEVTIELNPDDVTEEYLKMLIDLGVDRVSMGIQSFHPDLLTFMHRAHSRDEAICALEAIHKTKFPTFTADLIYGNPGQTPEMLQKDLSQLLAFDPPHISAYSLTIEPQTRLGKQVSLGRIVPPDDEIVAEHFEIVESVLSGAGLNRYEVSNFAKSGKEALHNSHYWNHHNYLGMGPSAHSFWWDETGARRWKNRSDLKDYLTSDPSHNREEEENLDQHTLAEERLFMGLRTKWGVSVEELAERYHYRFSIKQFEWIKNQAAGDFVSFEHQLLKMSGTGLKISDTLIVDLINRN